MPSSEQHLPDHLRDPELQARLVRALQRTYEISQERHDANLGDDALTFGVHIWRSGVHFLGPAIVAAGGAAEIVNQSLALRIGDIEMRHHKLGDSEFDNPSACFPNHAGPAARMIGRTGAVQLDLPIPEDEDAATRVYLDWVLGSYGNPDGGLRAVRLHAVGSQRALDGTISRWEAVYTLFDVSAGAAIPSVPDISSEDIAADMEITPEPDVELRENAADEDAAQPS